MRLRFALGFVVVVLSAAVWTLWPRDKPAVGVSAPLPPAKEVRTIEKIIIHPKLVYVYPESVKPKLSLPEEIKRDPEKKVIATATLQGEERQYTLSGVLDTQTGHTELFARPDPLPWLAPGRRGAIGVAYGLQNGEPTAKGYIYHDLLQVKALHAGARAEIDQRGEWWAGGYVEYRF